MAISLTHPFVSAIADGADTTLVQPSDWNDQHTLTLAASRLLGRATGSAGAAEEIPLGTGLSFSAGSLVFATAAIGTWIATPSSANLAAAVTDETGTGALVFANTPTLVTPILGTPTSGTLTNCTGLPISTGVSGLGTGVATFLATPSSANLASALTDETGSGTVLFSSAISDTAYAAAWNGDTTTAPSKNAVYDKIEALWHPGYVSLNYYVLTAWSYHGTTSVVAPLADTIMYLPFILPRAITVSDLGARVTTASAGGVFKLAVYANGLVGGVYRPTGTPVAETGDISTTSTGTLFADITGANVTLQANTPYWAALRADNTTVRFQSHAPAAPLFMSILAGTATANNLVDGTAAIGGVTSAETYANAWPDAASETFSEVTGSARFVQLFGRSA